MKRLNLSYEEMCPVCAECGEHITDDTFRRIGGKCYHDSCIEEIQTDSWVDDNWEDYEEE